MITEHPHAIEATEDLIHDLRGAISEVSFDRMTRLLYSTDASIYQMMPVGVALPRDVDEVSAVVEIAGKHGVPVLPRGGGSSLTGQSIGHALILDLSRYMNKVFEIDAEARTIRTQPGITLGKLNMIVSPYGLMYGPDPASGDRATMGGIVSNNSTGAHSIVYGMTHNHVHAVDVVLADANRVQFETFDGNWEARSGLPGLEGAIYRAVPGILSRYADEIATRYPKTFRHVAGYNLHLLSGKTTPNLASLVVGSEGSLGVITEATLNLVPIPKVKRLALVHFSELRAAMEAVPIILESLPTAIEVIDKMLLDLTRDRIEYRRLLTFVEGDPDIILLIEYAGDTDTELDAGIERLETKLRQINHHDPVIIASDKTQQANVWYVRKVGLGILMSIRGDAKPIAFIEDAAVPVEHLADYVTEISEYARSVGVERAAMYAHASAGCMHIRPLVNLKTTEGVRQLRQIAEKSVDLVVKYNGTTSGEHGDGIVRGEFLEQLFGPKMLEAFREVKTAFDPHNMMNPGKVVNVPKMDDETLLRYGTSYAVPLEPRETVFSFQDDGGFAGAVEMCNGAGVCRKLEPGVMCPSFQATRDETHSTRGRANALRAAMMGLLGPDGMTSKDLYQVLDLCLSCQACKSECPSGVDLAKLKAEFLHGYHQEHGTPLRSWIFANVAKLNKLAQPVAPLANLMMGGPLKWAAALVGVHPSRSLPRLAPQTFSQWYHQHKRMQNGAAAGSKQVILFHDTFMQHNHPQIGQAAIKILDAAGYETIVLDDKEDSGRPAVSKGLLDEAKKLARHNLKLLAPYAKRGIPILGCEPSSISMLVDEYPNLVPGEESRNLAQMTMMIDEFIVREAESGNISLRFDETPRRVLFHGHCQQKAIFGTEYTHKMLRLIPNCVVEEIDAGCCGMAGSFGYEKEHYELSIKLAEMSLAPAVRAAEAETIVCTTGTSCRDQILHTTGRAAIHPIEVLANAL